VALITKIERAADPTNVERYTWKAQDTATAVADHLRQMLMTKTGSSLTCPDYGVPDISHLLHDMTEAVKETIRAVKHSIQLYEPRLKNVQVRQLSMEVPGQVGMLLEISGHILLADGKRQAIRFASNMDEKCQITLEEM